MLMSPLPFAANEIPVGNTGTDVKVGAPVTVAVRVADPPTIVVLELGL